MLDDSYQLHAANGPDRTAHVQASACAEGVAQGAQGALMGLTPTSPLPDLAAASSGLSASTMSMEATCQEVRTPYRHHTRERARRSGRRLVPGS